MRLRNLAPPLRYAVYFVGALLAFLVAVGVGAMASLVVGWQTERTGIGSTPPAVTRTPESTGTMSGTTDASGGITIEADGSGAENADSEGPGEEADSFSHTATQANSRGDYTYLDHPALNGDPNAAVLVVSSEGAGDTDYPHNVGVWYEFAERGRWAIFNQDLAAVPAGATFRVLLPPASESFVHRAGSENTVGNVTYLDSPLTDGEPGAELSVTQNWNPGGGVGVYNDHAVGAFYDRDVDKWAVYNRDGAPMPRGAAFNVAVTGLGDGGDP